MKSPITDVSMDVPPVIPAPSAIPPLENGDRLNRLEFERRYEAMPNVKKAELIEGVVYMPSPVRLQRHGLPHARIIGWLFNYEAKTPGVWTGNETSARLDMDNEPQPDAMLLITPQCGGQARVSDDYVEGGPELVAEVASSSVSIDLNQKFRVYERNGVREYIVWRVLEQRIDWFELQNGKFEVMAPDVAGIIRSGVFPGLWLHVAAMLSGDLTALLSVLDQGVNKPDHEVFVERLRAAGKQ